MRKNILIIASPWLGGSGSVAFRIGDYLSQKADYNVFSLSYEIPFKKVGRNNEVKFLKLDSFKYPLFPFPLYELSLIESIINLVKKNNIKIIHAHYGILFGHAALIAKSILKSEGVDVKVILTLHGSDVLGFDLEKPGTIVPHNLSRWAIKQADEVTLASNNLLKFTKKIYKVNRHFNVIPNFIDTNNFKRTNYIFDIPTILHISNFRKVKQAHLVALAFKKIKKEVPNSKMMFVGEGPELSKVVDIVKKQSLKDVEITGKISNEKQVAKFFQNSHILMLPSIYENFSLSALEAQASGVPVVGSNSGGNTELIRHGKTGLLCEYNNLEKLTDNAISLLKDKEKWLKFSLEAQRFVKKFDTENIISRYINLYEQ